MQAKIGVLLLYVQDFPRMLKFYREILGLPLSKIHPGKGYESLVDWARFEPDGDTAVELFGETRHGPANALPLPRINALILAFQLQDTDAVYAKLKADGLEFPKGIGEEGWGRYVHFKDPGGNRLQLYEPRPGF